MIDLSMDEFIDKVEDILIDADLDDKSPNETAKEIWMWMISLKIQIKE